jgi:hypothetical protein
VKFFRLAEYLKAWCRANLGDMIAFWKIMSIFAKEILERRGVFNPSFCFQGIDGRFKDED